MHVGHSFYFFDLSPKTIASKPAPEVQLCADIVKSVVISRATRYEPSHALIRDPFQTVSNIGWNSPCHAVKHKACRCTNMLKLAAKWYLPGSNKLREYVINGDRWMTRLSTTNLQETRVIAKFLKCLYQLAEVRLDAIDAIDFWPVLYLRHDKTIPYA